MEIKNYTIYKDICSHRNRSINYNNNKMKHNKNRPSKIEKKDIDSRNYKLYLYSNSNGGINNNKYN